MCFQHNKRKKNKDFINWLLIVRFRQDFVNTLQTHYFFEIESEKPSFEIALYPAIEYENKDKPSIHLNLVINFSSNVSLSFSINSQKLCKFVTSFQYPNSVPDFFLKNIRGVSDEHVFKYVSFKLYILLFYLCHFKFF